MKKVFTAILAGALALPASPVEARDVVSDDGNQLLSDCADNSTYMQGFCLGYIRALDNSMIMLLALNNKKYCRPEGVTVGQVRDVYLSYIRRHPAERNQNNIALAISGNNEAWPCDGI